MPVSHLIEEMLEDPKSEIYKAMTNSDTKNLEVDGILVNTFTSLEPRAVQALTDPKLLCQSEFTMPPVYCVGPLVEGAVETKEKHECLAWLNEQPEHSVVFLSFGSVGTGNHSEVQLKEIAAGLERSGHRFLWVVQAPLGDNTRRGYLASMPTRTSTSSCPKGSWRGPKGVEMVGWQQGLVKAEEVEAKVRLVLDSEEGEKLRARVTAHKEAASMAWKNGGSSRAASGQFLLDAGKIGQELAHA